MTPHRPELDPEADTVPLETIMPDDYKTDPDFVPDHDYEEWLDAHQPDVDWDAIGNEMGMDDGPAPHEGTTDLW